MNVYKPLQLSTVRFHFVKINFKPYNDIKNHASRQILEKVIDYLSKESQAGKGILIDRHDGRGNEQQRPLFVTSAVYVLKDNRIKLSIALLRTGKIPMLKPADKFLLIPLDSGSGEIAELTHVFIDYSGIFPVMCVEFNQNGPRVSDIEYYFRVIARDKLQLAKATEMEFFMTSNLDQTISQLKEVLNFEIKMQPKNIDQLENVSKGYISGMITLGQKLKPRFLRVQALFQTQGRNQATAENKEAFAMIKHFLGLFKEKPDTSDLFENFTVGYRSTDGQDLFFDLLKEKSGFELECDPNETSDRKWYDLVKSYLDTFVSTLK